MINNMTTSSIDVRLIVGSSSGSVFRGIRIANTGEIFSDWALRLIRPRYHSRSAILARGRETRSCARGVLTRARNFAGQHQTTQSLQLVGILREHLCFVSALLPGSEIFSSCKRDFRSDVLIFKESAVIGGWKPPLRFSRRGIFILGMLLVIGRMAI